MLRRLKSPYGLPIPVSLAQLQLREVSQDEQNLVSACIASAVRLIEGRTGRSLLTSQWILTRDRFPSLNPDGSITASDGSVGYLQSGRSQWDYSLMSQAKVIELRICPLQTVAMVEYTDIDGNPQTLAEGIDYDVDAISEPGRIAPCFGTAWPTARKGLNTVQVTFYAGYATPFTANPGTDIVTAFGRPYANGETFRVSCPGAGTYTLGASPVTIALPGGLEPFTDYYVVNSSGTQFQLSLSAGGSPVDITDAGENGIYLLGELPETAVQAILFLVGHFWTNREAVGTDVLSKEIEIGFESLLWDLKWTVNG